jgi:hypothetical protein
VASAVASRAPLVQMRSPAPPVWIILHTSELFRIRRCTGSSTLYTTRPQPATPVSNVDPRILARAITPVGADQRVLRKPQSYERESACVGPPGHVRSRDDEAGRHTRFVYS